MFRRLKTFLLAAGFALTMIASGCSSSSTTPKAPTRPPVADAGPTKEAEISSQVFLDGTKSNDPDGGQLLFVWRQTLGTAVILSDSTAAAPTFMAPSSEGPLRFELTVRNGNGGTNTDNTLVMVTASSGNTPPTANAGVDQSVAIGSTVTLYGSGSSPFGGPVAFKWVQTNGPSVSLSDDTVAKPTFTAPSSPVSLTFELTVKDEDDREAKDDADVTVVGTPPIRVPTLFVINPGGSLSGFQNPHLKDGDKAPEKFIFGNDAQVNNAQALVVDGQKNLLVATRAPQISVFSPTNQSGEISPDRAVNGAETLMTNPGSLAVGPNSDILLVGDVSHNAIGVWDRVSKPEFNGSTPPSRVFWIEGIPLVPAYIAYDETRDMLYVYDFFTHGFMVFNGASSANGKVVWNRAFTVNPLTNEISGIMLDVANDRLYATNSARGLIIVWDGASTLRGTVNASRVVTIGGTPLGIAVDSGDRAYVGDANLKQIRSFDGISTLNGNATANRTIQGEGTQLGITKQLVIME